MFIMRKEIYLEKFGIFVLLMFFFIIIYSKFFLSQNSSIKYRINDNIEFSKITSEERRAILGRSSWTLLHSMAAVYPAYPSIQMKKNTLEFLYLFTELFPCKNCSRDFKKIIKDSPPKVATRDEFVMWMCHIHNKVNHKLNKPIFNCKNIDDRWQCGCNGD
ncbi:Mitochondrial-type FAD-linked sulfhydryl oxidase ERV1 [Spraguea lophii 42_110]|uniref:Sulfhydryl oxidase n=1 Tax=Spraguea lophii (strain 42_110) TaxID=1358809 RepID=S7W8T8_SPRLO|nr:Mitochondrial-type FAD-linked sulfhydryl oxidase ERV1 [Spraguea lophii 42_110]